MRSIYYFQGMKEIKDNEASYHKVYDSGWKEFFIKQHYLVPFAFYLPISFICYSSLS
jgi:hypothetical protein